MTAAALRDALAPFDEAALELLANKGLVRRAARDLAEQKVRKEGAEADAALILADGETVRIDKRGPQSAQCSCPALGMCRHILAAVLLMRAQADADESSEPARPETFPASELAEFTTAAIRKWAGKAGWLGALDLLERGASVRDEGKALVVLLGDHEVRILAGQGLDGIMSKATPALRKTLHCAALLAARRQAGIVEDDIGTAPSEATASEPEIKRVDPAFLADVRATLADCARLALNLAPVPLEERLFVLSVSSKVDALPRLGALLRLLSAQIRSRRAREFSFDPDRCAEVMGEAHALLKALEHAELKDDAARRSLLAGQARQEYLPAATVRLHGLGADRWEASAGARGVTGFFYDPHGDRWLTAALARAAGQDALFDPRQAYEGESLWGGPSLKSLARSEITLENAAISSTGRLSLARTVRVRPGPPTVLDEAWACCLSDWDGLRARLHARLSGGIAQERRSLEPVILMPARVAKPIFDELAQRLDWPLEDESGQWIRVSLDHGRDRAGLLSALEHMAQRGWKGQIIALASIEGQSFRLRPIATIENGQLTNLGLDPMPDQSAKARAGQFMRSMGALLSGVPTRFEGVPQVQSRQALAQAWSTLVEMAELGLGHGGGLAENKLPKHVRDLNDCGFETASRQIAVLHQATPERRIMAFLDALYAVRLTQHHTISLPLLVGAR